MKGVGVKKDNKATLEEKGKNLIHIEGSPFIPYWDNKAAVAVVECGITIY